LPGGKTRAAVVPARGGVRRPHEWKKQAHKMCKNWKKEQMVKSVKS